MGNQCCATPAKQELPKRNTKGGIRPEKKTIQSTQSSNAQTADHSEESLPNSQVLSETDDIRQENTAIEDGQLLENSFGQRVGQNHESTSSDMTQQYLKMLKDGKIPETQQAQMSQIEVIINYERSQTEAAYLFTFKNGEQIFAGNPDATKTLHNPVEMIQAELALRTQRKELSHNQSPLLVQLTALYQVPVFDVKSEDMPPSSRPRSLAPLDEDPTNILQSTESEKQRYNDGQQMKSEKIDSHNVTTEDLKGSIHSKEIALQQEETKEETIIVAEKQIDVAADDNLSNQLEIEGQSSDKKADGDAGEDDAGEDDAEQDDVEQDETATQELDKTRRLDYSLHIQHGQEKIFVDHEEIKDGESDDQNENENENKQIFQASSEEFQQQRPLTRTQHIELSSNDENSNYDANKLAFSMASPTSHGADTSMAGLSMASISMGETSSQNNLGADNSSDRSDDSRTEVVVLKNQRSVLSRGQPGSQKQPTLGKLVEAEDEDDMAQRI